MIGILLIILGLIGLYLLFLIGFAFLGAWLWNLILIPLFHFPMIEWWQILGLEILLWILLPGHSVVKEIKELIDDD
jgi:hypothetical protein